MMPTLLQLPQVAAVDGDDLVLVEHRGAAVAATATVLRAGLQEEITLAGEVLLGRRGPLVGGPEPIAIGAGLAMADGQLAVDGAVVALLDGPELSGVPTAPTQAVGDVSNAIATTAFVHANQPPSTVMLVGDAVGSGHTGSVVEMVLPAITTAGTFSKVVVNAKGQVTGGLALSAVDVSGLAPVATSGSYSDLSGVPAGYVLPAASVSVLGGVKVGSGLAWASDGTVRLASVLPSVDASAVMVTAGLGGATARALSDIRGEVIRVADLLGSTPDGHDATNAMVLALGLAANRPGSTIELCAGAWSFGTLSGSLAVPSRTTIRGAGRHQTRMTWPDGAGFALFAAVSSGSARANDIVLADFSVTGGFAANGPAGQFPFLLNFVDGLHIRNICSEYSRAMGIVARNCTDVHVSGCVVRYCAIDGINVAECNGVTIESCLIEHCDDDGIAVHSDVFDPGVVRRGVVVSGNRLFDCQGIKVLSPRGTIIVGNTVDCCRAQGISFATLAASGSQIEGMAAGMASLICGNVVTNIVNRTNVDNLNQGAPGIIITGASSRGGSLGAVPGEARSGGVVDPYPYFNANSTATTVPTPGSFGMIVSNNFVGRTLPACNGTVTTPVAYTKWSDYGNGRMFTRNGWLDPSLAESDIRDHAILLAGGVLRDVLIADNVIRGMTSGLALLQAARMDNIVFRSNQVVDCVNYGVLVNTTGTLRAYIEDNIFDLDPFLKHANRGGNGTWVALGDPTGVKAQAGSGVFVRRNIFRNLCRDSDQSSDGPGGTWLFEGNVVEADPVAIGFSSANKGVGYMRTAAGTVLAQTDSNPGSATFGQMLTAPSVAAWTPPTAGKWLVGHFVRNSSPVLATGLVNMGWTRLTTGSNNVIGTDWSQALAVGGNVSGPLVLAGPASGSSVPGFRQLTASDVAGAAPAPAVTHTYVASGAIAVTDNLALVNAAGAVTMTLGVGALDGHPIVVKRFGVGTVTLSATVDGVAATQIRMTSTTVKESVSLAWSSTLASWLMI